MSTASTKSRAGKTKRGSSARAREEERAPSGATLAEQPDGPQVSERVWLTGRILVLFVAALLRLYNLALVPLHHDEGVNGNFLMRLFRDGYYHYDPANYHGPTLYYFALAITYLFGPTTFAIRLLPALFGIASVWLVLSLRWRLGALAALAGGALLAVSPGAVYMSRYFIHESLFVFFTLGIIYCALKYYDEANPFYLWLASTSAALLFATKETAIINAGVLLIALGGTIVYAWLRGSAAGKSDKVKRERGRAQSKGRAAEERMWEEPLGALARFGGPTTVLLATVIAVAVFIILNVLFYSSFFTNWNGVHDALATFKFWTSTGKKEHVHEWYAYLSWLWQEEAPLLLLGAAGIAVAVWRARNRLAVFIALWAFGILAAYSLVPYKTPWLMLNFIVPLAITGGYALEAIYDFLTTAVPRRAWRITGGYALEAIYDTGEERRLFGQVLALALVATALCIGLYQTVSLNFFNYDDDRYPYVYAHTRRETLQLISQIERLAKKAGTNEQTGITITSPDYWPLPWYLREYKRVGYFGQISATGEPLIIGREDQSAQLQSTLGERYRKVGSYVLRPGVTLVLYARSDLLP